MKRIRPFLVVPGLLSVVVVLAGLLAAQKASAYAEPAIISPSWNLTFTYQKPQAISFTKADGSIAWYWFMPYKVVNNTGEDRLFVPEFTIATNRGQILHAGRNVPPGVYDAIAQRLGNKLLMSPLDVVGKLLQGPDYARESVAIWPAFEHNVDAMAIFVTGLSGETQTVANPLTGKPVLMHRTLMLQYKLPGNPLTPQTQPVVLERQRDVMR